MSFDFGGSLDAGSIDSAPVDVPADVNVDPGSADYGSEQLTTDQAANPGDQVANQSGNSDFVNATDPSATQTAPETPSGYQNEASQLADGNGTASPSAIDGLKDSAASAVDKAKDAASGALDKITSQASSTLTKLEDQFSAKNIEAFATKTAKSLVTQVENTAINLAKTAANKALSTVVGPAAAASLTNAATRSLTGPSTTGAKTVSSSVDPNSPNFVGPPAPSNTSAVAAPSGYQNEAQQNADNPIDAPATAPSGYQNEAQQNADGNGGVPTSQVDKSAANVGYVTGQDPENGTYYVKNEQTGAIVSSGLTEQQAMLKAQDQTFVDAGDVPATANASSTAVNYNAPGIVADPNLATLPSITNTDLGSIANANTAAMSAATGGVQGLIRQAQNQQTARLQTQTKAAAGDWRVRLSLAPNSNYLYNATDCGPVLYPLYNTQGVIFPYTPSIDLGYKANYTQYDLTHSNYRGYFYQSSYVDGINVKGTFTAQDTSEANYLLAVIHFFRSVTKMFYGQDSQAGSPPPLVFLSGLGDFQFNQHPCVVSQFNYSLPSDVNYIRAQTVANSGTDQISARTRQTTLNPISNAIQRLASLGQGIQPGALAAPFATLGSLSGGNPTYVPTKMDINITLLPIQSRQQVSQQFSLKGFANGNLLKGGFW